MSDGYSLKQRLLLLLVSFAGPLLIRLYGATWRVKWEGTRELEEARKATGNVLFCFWHSRLLSLCYTHRFHNIGIMVSKSFDGEWISRIVTHLGYRVFRGSASRDGAAALVTMLKRKDIGDLSLTVDGPRGPAYQVKPGIVTLAAHSGLPLVPITCVASRAWRLNSWDKFILPKPFTTLTVRYGRKIDIPEKIDRDDMPMYLNQIEEGINRIG